MTLLATLAAAVLGFQAPAAPVKPPDRSGEPALRRIMDWAKSLDNVHGVILRSSRDEDGRPMYPDGQIDFWLSAGKYRVEISTMWGDGFIACGDGKSVLIDTQSEDKPATILDAKPSLVESVADLAFKGDQMAPFFYLIQGSGGFDKLVGKSEAVREEADRDGCRVVRIDSKELGLVRLLYRDEQGKARLESIEYDNQPWLLEQHVKYPEWMDEPVPGTLTRHRIVVMSARPARGLFIVDPPKGRKVEDKRAKKARRGGLED